ncbi:OmpA family protein [Cellulomonas sp. S1-8]|uniref:OmpA family protein n=1 Tax=Cellulomonas sp. S1-8 TaxID=2904790 RepID=UPI00224440DF|nr:OmpA family protein [Cellulomonas sp. S1-8]UZN03518.1 OmpA family protein [Cellulomonas sp. S1-8]
MRTLRPATLIAATLTLTLVACTGGDPAPGPDRTTTPTVTPGPQPEDVVATAAIPSDGMEIEVGVHPVVRVGDLAVLTLDLTAQDPIPEIGWVHVEGFGTQGITHHVTRHEPSNVRLVDLERDVVLHVATDAAGDPVVAPERWGTLDEPEGGRLQIAYAAPDPRATEVAVFLPGAPMVAAVPVIDGDVPSSVRPATASSSATATSDVDVLDLDAVADAPVFSLESSSAELEGAVQTVESTEKVDIALGSDVLFEFDQAVLTPAADAALRLVAQRLTEREPGTVGVVGHTDDQGDDAYNADLSLARAQTVADALGALVDTASYPMTVDGRGEAEPFVPNDSEENRALNRRVTVTLTSTVVTRTDLTTTGELPPFGEDGQVGPAGTPLRIEGGRRVWEVDATARRVHGHVVVDVTVHGADDEENGMGDTIGSLDGGPRGRGAGTSSPDASARGVLLHGATRLFPLDYRTGESEQHPGGEWFPLTDLASGGRIDGGQTRTYTFVFPSLDVDSVTFQAGDGDMSTRDFRLVDLPVTPGGA